MKLTALALAFLASCSFVMTDRPKPPPQPPGCTQSYGPVGLDIAGALTWPWVLAVAYVGASSDDITDVDDDKAATAGLLAVGTLVAHIVSAGVGISRVGDCRAAHRQRVMYPQYPQPYYPYPQPYPQQPYPQQPPQQPQQPQPPAPQPQPPAPEPRGLGIEGDACGATSECAAGLTCRANRCAR